MYEIRNASARVEKEILSLPEPEYTKVTDEIDQLSKGPRPPGVKKIGKGKEAAWRIRVGNYRIIYDIYDKEKIVVILKVKHRREAYR